MKAAWLAVPPWLAALAGLVAGLCGCGDSTGYARSGGTWAWEGGLIAAAEAGSFVPLDARFARDASNGYYRGQAIPGSRGATFVALSEHEARDAASVYFCDTFRKAGEYWTVQHARIVRIDGADPATYRPLDQGYARDVRRVYLAGRPFEVRDPASFEPLAGGYARDRQRGYFARIEIRDSHGPTFRVLDAEGAGHARDRDHVWFGTLETDTPNRRPYPVVRMLARADVAALRVLGRGYAADGRQVWFRGLPLAGADVATFRVDTTFLGEVDATDRLGAWRAGERRHEGVDRGAAP